MKLIVGLGNPSKKYENTRHNVGFMTIDKLADDYGVRVDRLRDKALVGEFNLLGEKIILAKPQTFMNLSGESVGPLLNYYKLGLEDLLVIYDDVHLDFGSLRFKSNGSAGGHNGMKSIIKHVGGQDFPRLRVSVGRKPDYMDLKDYVLSKFSKEEKKVLEKEIEAAADAVICFIKEGPEAVMNKFNGLDLNV